MFTKSTSCRKTAANQTEIKTARENNCFRGLFYIQMGLMHFRSYDVLHKTSQRITFDLLLLQGYFSGIHLFYVVSGWMIF